MSWCSNASEICKHCKLSDFQEGYGPRTLLLCDGCETIGSHVECEERAHGTKIGKEILTAGHSWYCSKVRIFASAATCFSTKYLSKSKISSSKRESIRRLVRRSQQSSWLGLGGAFLWRRIPATPSSLHPSMTTEAKVRSLALVILPDSTSS